MTFNEFLVFVHVLMAALWVGSSFALQLFALRATRSRDSARVAAFSGDAEWMGTRVFMPLSVLLLVFGVWAAVDGDWDFGSAWISIGFAVVILSAVAGMAFFGPESARLRVLVAEHGVEAPEVKRRIRRILTVSRVELVLLIVAIWAMVAKP